jgi:hypothetical protein
VDRLGREETAVVQREVKRSLPELIPSPTQDVVHTQQQRRLLSGLSYIIDDFLRAGTGNRFLCGRYLPSALLVLTGLNLRMPGYGQ